MIQEEFRVRLRSPFVIPLVFGLAISVSDTVDLAFAQQSATVCDSYARTYAENSSRQGQVIGRGALGSLVGAGIGAAFDGAGAGAAIGATVGILSGGSSRRQTANNMYNAAYADCMAGRVR